MDFNKYLFGISKMWNVSRGKVRAMLINVKGFPIPSGYARYGVRGGKQYAYISNLPEKLISVSQRALPYLWRAAYSFLNKGGLRI